MKFAPDFIMYWEFEWGFTVICELFLSQLWGESAKVSTKLKKSKPVRKL